MIYVVRKVGDAYEVRDTVAATSELLTEALLVKRVCDGARIQGCHFGSREDLRVQGHFRSIEGNQTVYPDMTVKAGHLYKFVLKAFEPAIKGEKLGVVLELDTYKDIVTLLTSEGEILKVYNYKADFKVPRNVPVKLREGLVSLYALYIKKQEVQNEIQRLYVLSSNLTDQFNNSVKNISALSGITPTSTIIRVVTENIAPQVRSALDNLGLSMEFDRKANEVTLEAEMLLGKYMQNLSFVEQEYDGTYHMGKENEEYRRILAKNSIQLKLRNLKLSENLFIGDKISLWYHCRYTLIVPEQLRDYSEESCKRIGQLIM